MKIASPFLQNQQNPFLCACRKSAQKLPCGAGSTLHAGWSFFLYEKSVLHESDCLRGSGQEVCTDSPSCLRNVRTSASSSRMRCCSRLRRLAWPIWIPDAFSQLRSVSIQIPSSLAASVGCRPCSVTKRAAPALNSSSYRGGGVPFLAFFSSIFFAPFLSTLRLVSLSVNMAIGH